jgi:hypothetical protein
MDGMDTSDTRLHYMYFLHGAATGGCKRCKRPSIVLIKFVFKHLEFTAGIQ